VSSKSSLTLQPRKFVAGGAALATAPDGRAVFIEGALPGETVLARVTKNARDYLLADLERVLDPAPERITPVCPAVARGCGGCNWQHIDPAHQHAFKTAIVADALTRTARITDVPVRTGRRVPAAGYRTTLRVMLDQDGQPAFRRAGSHQPVVVKDCLVAHPALAALLAELRLPGAAEAQLRVSAHEGTRSLTWTPAGPALGQQIPTGIHTASDAFHIEVVRGSPLRVSSEAFFQSGAAAAELLVDAVARAAGPPESWGAGPVVDAYGGVGLFSATLVPEDRAVILVEANAVACADAAVNLHGRTADIVALEVERWKPTRAGLVIADPARTGLGREAVTVLSRCQAPLLVLVSCDPVAFARDTRLLAEAGYRLTDCETLDLFPHTHHVEVVSRFERADAEKGRRVSTHRPTG
jgi:23S rRNA (uracil1939-C5)-methyltransferase